MNYRRHRVWSVVLLLTLASTACGPAESRTGAKPEQSDGKPTISGPLETVAAAGDASGGAVAHVAMVNGSPQTVVSNLANGRDTVVPAGAPLLSPTVWVSANEIGVVGAVCRSWRSGGAPHWDDDSERNIPDLCGSIDYRGWIIERSTGDVRQLSFTGLRGMNGVIALGARDGEVLLATQGFDATTYALNTRDGHVAILPPALDTGGSAEAQYVVCLGDGGRPFAIMAWTGEPPPSVTANGWETEAMALDDGSTILTVVASGSDNWVPTHLEGTAPTFRWQKGCDESGVWSVGNSGGGRIEVSDEKALLTAVKAPPEGTNAADISIVPLRGGGPPLAVVQPPLTAQSVDGPRIASGYLWEGKSWRAVASVDLAPSSIVFQNGGSIAALQEEPGDVPSYELQVR